MPELTMSEEVQGDDQTTGSFGYESLLTATMSRWSETEERVLNEHEDEMTAMGTLEPSTSTISGGAFLTLKEDGTCRMVF
ncbi:uncharacterized protein SPPG_08198 [Spizellomyces punctatus DAOM BR117]|uniref:Uncharacterized protein n=1 Tax=Spizellomyces punctatus (strain DAOM BR117) TaxID=645134 RepID=A0A0L0H6X0_SPIPD|nr:uncharacterized protein SPPG_08198 [Spizellomyces punctatus DAOM BR117]KNC96616.1 hypothetical protein SPPG_08198 [Spizellomyces punctatus DAOM BR117]|eukprot:XP_016604656.1 hypothetical protein SPPG_08198 [Spizellomyces punctatus DAOM BR117]